MEPITAQVESQFIDQQYPGHIRQAQGGQPTGSLNRLRTPFISL